MNFAMENAVLITLPLALGALTAVVLTMPRWLARSMCRHRLWRLRDEYALHVIEGRLPRHQASFELICDIESMIDCAHRVGLRDVLVFQRLHNRLSPPAHAQLVEDAARAPVDALPSDERYLLEVGWTRLERLRVAIILYGSWLGLIVVAPVAARAFLTRKASPQTATGATAPSHADTPGIDATASRPSLAATVAEEAASQSRLGRITGEYVRENRRLVAVGQN